MGEQSITVQIYEWLYMVACYALFVLYLLIIKLMIKYRKTELKGPFFTLFTAMGITDCARAVVWYLCYDLPRWSIFRSFFLCNNFVATWAAITYTFGLRLSRILNVLLGINRMCAMKKPFAYKSQWNPKMVKKCIAVALLISAVLNLQCLASFGLLDEHAYTTYAPFPNSSGLSLGVFNIDWSQYVLWFLLAALEGALLIPTYLAIYGIAFWSVHKHNNNVVPKTNVNPGASNDYAAEIKLSMMSFILALIQIAYVVQTGVAVIFYEIFFHDPYLYYVGLSTIVQLDGLINPFLLIIMSTVTRECFINLITCKT